MTRGWRFALSAGLLLAGCSKKPATTQDPACTDTAEEYVPSASDIPLPGDYTQSAAKRIGPDNYKRELERIAREIAAGEGDLLPEPKAEEGEAAAH